MTKILAEASSSIAAWLSANLRSPRTRMLLLAAFGLSGAAAVATAVAPQSSELIETQSAPFTLPAGEVVALDDNKDAVFREERVRKGDTLGSVLARLGVDDAEAAKYLRQDKAARIITNQLRPGRNFKASTAPDGSLARLDYLLSPTERITVLRDGSGFGTAKETLELERRVQMNAGIIRSSLFGATDAAGIPDAVAVQIAEIFAADIDFHRDLRKGDAFRVVYETLHHHGEHVSTGRVLAVEFVNKNKPFAAIWYEEGEHKGYYTPDGNSLRKAFLKAPLEFSRITSGFGMRMHPIWKTWKGHAGVDYAAPTGTPIRTVSDGTVDFIGKQGGYGNVVIVKHQGKYSTLYAHMSAFANKLSKGDRVSQGDVIGFVGSTGWSTGPHLHYEFRIDNEQVDPLTVALPQAVPLDAAKLAAFKAATAPLNLRLSLFKGEAAKVAANFE